MFHTLPAQLLFSHVLDKNILKKKAFRKREANERKIATSLEVQYNFLSRVQYSSTV